MGPTMMEDNGKKKEKEKEKKKKTQGGESVGGADGDGNVIGDEWRR